MGKWTIALEQQASGDTSLARSDAQRERQELLDAVERNPGVRHLAANPLLLTILALMKRQGVRLPERRVELYDKYVEVLLSTWNRARSLDRPGTRDIDVIGTLRILAPLALWMHETNPGVGLVKRPALLQELERIYENRGEQGPEGSSRQFLEDVREHAGLLLERGQGEYGFIHLTFEEYLAAVGVAQLGQQDVQRVVDYLEGCVGQPAWREVALLTIGYLGLVQRRDEAAGAVVEALTAGTAGEPGAAAILAGEAVADAGSGVVPAGSKDKVIARLVPVMQTDSVAPSLRREAGLVLGRLGWSPADLDCFVQIPAGDFLYGDAKEPRTIGKPYQMGKYLVTNSQYQRFLQAKGCAEEGFWSKEGWSWRTGLSDSQAPDWLRDLLAERPPERRTEPFFWRDPVRAAPLCPVVGVSWFEAEAYCNWLTRELRTWGAVGPDEVARLPTEREWERAARDTDGREYPWEGEFQAAFANTSESELGGTTAVCTYPQGASPPGAWDMSGNVWEWTGSLASQDETERRIVRGGSWINVHRSARCAHHNGLRPGGFSNYLGFRVVLSLANSES